MAMWPGQAKNSSRVICHNGFGKEPESQAFEKTAAWARKHDLIDRPHRLFGYNNPNPTPGSPNYGYDVWMTVDKTVQAEGEARIVEFTGGLYAVMRLKVTDPGDEIPKAWRKLVLWREKSRYHEGRHQWLEEHIGSIGDSVNQMPFTLDLYLPIKA